MQEEASSLFLPKASFNFNLNFMQASKVFNTQKLLIMFSLHYQKLLLTLSPTFCYNMIVLKIKCKNWANVICSIIITKLSSWYIYMKHHAPIVIYPVVVDFCLWLSKVTNKQGLFYDCINLQYEPFSVFSSINPRGICVITIF